MKDRYREVIGNTRQALAMGLFLTALSIRLFIIGMFAIPNIIYVPVEVLLCVWALYLERSRLSQFFIGFGRWKSDVIFGLVAAVIWCSLEYLIEGSTSTQERSFYLDTFLAIPIFLLIAGWRAGVYEELLFRSLLMGYGRMIFGSPIGAILLQALIFWLGHPRYYMHGLWFHSASNFLFGLLMGIIVYKRRSIIPSVIVHSISNTYGIMGTPLGVAFTKVLASWLR